MLENMNGRAVTGIPQRRRAFFHSGIQRLTSVQYRNLTTEIDRRIQSAGVHISSYMQPGGDWLQNTVYAPLVGAFLQPVGNVKQARDEAGRLLGLIIWDRFIQSSDTWIFKKSNVGGICYWLK